MPYAINLTFIIYLKHNYEYLISTIFLTVKTLFPHLCILNSYIFPMLLTKRLCMRIWVRCAFNLIKRIYCPWVNLNQFDMVVSHGLILWTAYKKIIISTKLIKTKWIPHFHVLKTYLYHDLISLIIDCTDFFLNIAFFLSQEAH